MLVMALVLLLAYTAMYLLSKYNLAARIEQQ